MPAETWSLTQTADTVLHLIPDHDSYEHETRFMCPCRAKFIALVQTDGWTVGWTVQHQVVYREVEE